MISVALFKDIKCFTKFMISIALFKDIEYDYVAFHCI